MEPREIRLFAPMYKRKEIDEMVIDLKNRRSKNTLVISCSQIIFRYFGAACQFLALLEAQLAKLFSDRRWEIFPNEKLYWA